MLKKLGLQTSVKNAKGIDQRIQTNSSNIIDGNNGNNQIELINQINGNDDNYDYNKQTDNQAKLKI